MIYIHYLGVGLVYIYISMQYPRVGLDDILIHYLRVGLDYIYISMQYPRVGLDYIYPLSRSRFGLYIHICIYIHAVS